MEINRKSIQKVMSEYFVKPDKDYGQNFLVEPEICNKIVSLLEVKPEDDVLEIGPGIGSLTHFLNLEPCKLSVVDIDERMIYFLKNKYSKSEINFITNDIRKEDVSKYNKIIANLPYNITTEAIVYLLTNAKNCELMVLMCQTEAFFHFSDLEGKEYGPSSVLVHLLGEISRKITAKPGSFYPAPKCTSTVFTIRINPEVNKEEAVSVYKMCKQLFLNRRKTIYNNLSNYLKNKEQAAKACEACGIELNTRPEQITPSKFLEMYHYLF